MNVSRLVFRLACVGLFSWCLPAVGAAQPGITPACDGFNPYTWTKAQVEACAGPVNWGPDLNPYNSLGQPLFVPVKTQAFANVLVGLPGQDNDYGAYLILENDTEFNWVEVIIRRELGPEIVRRWPLAPGQRKVERLNDWPELAGTLPLGVSVRVKWMKEGNAGVAMHRARDFGSMVQAVEGGGTK